MNSAVENSPKATQMHHVRPRFYGYSVGEDHRWQPDAGNKLPSANMDKGHRNIHQNLTKENQQSASQSYDQDSAESDTESLAQERAYQQQLRLNISNCSPSESVLHNKSISSSHEKDEGSDDNEAEDLQLFDSLEMSNSQHVKKTPVLLQGKNLDKRHERHTKSQVFLDDTDSHLCYYANPKMISNEAGWSDEGPLISIDKSFLGCQEKHDRERKQAVRKDGYTLMTSTSPPVMMTPQNHSYDQPYLLHPGYGRNSAITIPTPTPPHSNTFGPLDEDHNRSFTSIDTCSENANNSSPADLTEENATPNQKYTERKTVQEMDKMMSPKIQRPTEDIVERNKLTLGRNASKYGSYSKAHALKMPQNPIKAQQASKATSCTGIQNKKWLQKTQQVKVSQMSKEKKAQRKESLNPPQPQQPPAPEVNAELGDTLSFSLTKAVAKTQRKPPSSSQPLAPTIHLKINLNTIPHLPPFPTQKGQESIINLVSFHDSPHINPELQIALSPRHKQTNQRMSSMIYQKEFNTHFNYWNLENTTGQWQRLAALKEQPSCQEENPKEYLTEVQTTQFVQQLSGSPTSSLSQNSSSYKVLPPIGWPGPEKEPELSSTQAGQRRVSDGYLVQMEKQKLLKTRPAYKAYSLNDYKQLKPNVTLRGLGPDYTAVEKTKMRRQKLYSNVIREQNKKITWIPSLPAKDPEANDKKVPRMKALEYAKTIAKPLMPVQPKVKEKQMVNLTEDLTEPASCVEGLDLTQLTTLELLRKRHEKEKQAVALLRKIHAI